VRLPGGPWGGRGKLATVAADVVPMAIRFKKEMNPQRDKK
jgi:hypothetical protein